MKLKKEPFFQKENGSFFNLEILNIFALLMLRKMYIKIRKVY